MDSHIAESTRSTTTESKLLSVREIHKTYHGERFEVEALKGVSFDLYKKEMLAIMGTSGSGKSTLLNIIGALDAPDAGSIYLQGKSSKHLFSEPYATEFRRSNIGFIFQAFHLLADLNVKENIALPLILKGLSTHEIKAKTDEALDFVKLGEWKDHRPAQLSGGQQQRVAIARALVTAPPIILADEPTGNLDYNTSTEILEVLVDTKKQLGQSMIVVTHDPTVAAYADRILFFHDGEIRDQYVCQRNHDDIANIMSKFKNLIEAGA